MELVSKSEGYAAGYRPAILQTGPPSMNCFKCFAKTITFLCFIYEIYLQLFLRKTLLQILLIASIE